MKLQNIEDIKKAGPGPGDNIYVKGYVDSSGDVSDRSLLLVTPDTYGKMIRADLELLNEADVADMDDTGTYPVADLLLARQQLIEAKTKAINKDDGEADNRRGPTYVRLSEESSVAVLSGDDDSSVVYVLHAKEKGKPKEPKPAKGAVPRAKQYLIKRLDLPSRYYVHVLKFTDGKFDYLILD